MFLTLDVIRDGETLTPLRVKLFALVRVLVFVIALKNRSYDDHYF